MKKTAALVALAALIAWPTVGDAATKKKKAHARPAAHRTAVAPRPSAAVGLGVGSGVTARQIRNGTSIATTANMPAPIPIRTCA